MAQVKATWTPSVSKGVSAQKVSWTVDGKTNVVEVGPTVTTQSIEVEDGQKVHVSVTAVKGALQSAPAMASVEVPFTIPAAVTNLKLEIVQ